MLSEPYEVVAIVNPEQSPKVTLPQTVLVKIYEDQCESELETAVLRFLDAEKPICLYHTVPVGSTEDYIEYWIDYSCDATDRADRLREQLREVYLHSGG